VPDLLARPELRLAFVIQIAGSRHDARGLDPRSATVSLKEVRNNLLPLLRVESRPLEGDLDTITRSVNAATLSLAERLLAWTPAEREFLDRLLDRGEVAATVLADDPARQALIRGQPLLQWKAFNVRKFKGLPVEDPAREA
jgi:hypothetical protein